MKRKPLSIKLIAILFFLAPVGNILQIAYFNGWPLTGPRGTIYHLDHFEWFVLAMFPIVAVGIWRVTSWGYLLCMGFAAFLILNNTWALLHNDRAYSPYVILLFQLVTFASIGLFLHHHVAAPYFNPRMRWWETEKRHRVNLRGQLRNGTTIMECQVLDISNGGCFIMARKKMHLGDEVMLHIIYGHKHVTIKSEVMWVKDANEGYGLMFGSMTKHDRKILKDILTELWKRYKKSVAGGPPKHDSIPA